MKLGKDNPMDWNKKRIVTIAFFVLVASTSATRACIVTFINDSGTKVSIEQSDGTFTVLEKNKRRRIGSQDSPAIFKLYVLESNNVFSFAYACKQISCSVTGALELKFSDIKNSTGMSDLFEISKGNPHISMVQRVLSKYASQK
jgi:hypothetical protein